MDTGGYGLVRREREAGRKASRAPSHLKAAAAAYYIS